MNFSLHCLLVVFHRRLDGSKSFRVSWTLLGILADLNNAVVWIVSILPLISNSSRLFSKPLETVLSAPTTTCITVTFMFQRSKYLYIFWLSFIFTQWFARTAKSIRQRVLFLLINTSSGFLVKIWWSQNPRDCLILSDGFIPFDCPVGWGSRIPQLLLCRGVKPPPTNILDITLNNLMVRFQWCWGFGECGALLHCHCSHVHSVPEW